MCAIFGATLAGIDIRDIPLINAYLAHIWYASAERGRDGEGYIQFFDNHPLIEARRKFGRNEFHLVTPKLDRTSGSYCAIGNLRAEPTTEYVQNKCLNDQQPYCIGPWAIVHNGTIANDAELRTNLLKTKIDSAAIVEQLNCMTSEDPFAAFEKVVRKLKGSFAILATHSGFPNWVFAAANYRPIWYATHNHGTYFASARHYFPRNMVPSMLEPYSVAVFNPGGLARLESLRPPVALSSRALVVCSGGLDSVVAATFAQKALDYEIELIHFLYGSRAQGPEVDAVRSVAQALGCKLHLFPLNIYSKEDSPLLDSNSVVAGGEAGAEFAYEWVPARNLVMLSVATAFAEARGIGTLVLGNNLEEAGAYPDNEPEFIAKFNDMLPFAVADGKRMQVIMPVGNMMKHEIVKLGHEIGAPLELTWSCYRAGDKHCGTCGPCFMRRTAFRINNLPEVISYIT